MGKLGVEGSCVLRSQEMPLRKEAHTGDTWAEDLVRFLPPHGIKRKRGRAVWGDPGALPSLQRFPGLSCHMGRVNVRGLGFRMSSIGEGGVLYLGYALASLNCR